MGVEGVCVVGCGPYRFQMFLLGVDLGFACNFVHTDMVFGSYEGRVEMDLQLQFLFPHRRVRGQANVTKPSPTPCWTGS